MLPGVDRAATHPNPVPDTSPRPTTTTTTMIPEAIQLRIRAHHPACTPAQISPTKGKATSAMGLTLTATAIARTPATGW